MIREMPPGVAEEMAKVAEEAATYVFSWFSQTVSSWLGYGGGSSSSASAAPVNLEPLPITESTSLITAASRSSEESKNYGSLGRKKRVDIDGSFWNYFGIVNPEETRAKMIAKHKLNPYLGPYLPCLEPTDKDGREIKSQSVSGQQTRFKIQFSLISHPNPFLCYHLTWCPDGLSRGSIDIELDLKNVSFTSPLTQEQLDKNWLQIWRVLAQRDLVMYDMEDINKLCSGNKACYQLWKDTLAEHLIDLLEWCSVDYATHMLEINPSLVFQSCKRGYPLRAVLRLNDNNRMLRLATLLPFIEMADANKLQAKLIFCQEYSQYDKILFPDEGDESVISMPKADPVTDWFANWLKQPSSPPRYTSQLSL